MIHSLIRKETHAHTYISNVEANKTHLQKHIYYIIPALLKNERSCGLRCLSYIAVRISALLQIFWLLPLSLHHVVDVVVWFIAVFCSLFCDIRINYGVFNISVLLFLEFLRNNLNLHLTKSLASFFSPRSVRVPVNNNLG